MKLARSISLSSLLFCLFVGSTAQATITVSQNFNIDAADPAAIVATYPNIGVLNPNTANVTSGLLRISTDGTEAVGFAAPVVAGMADFGSEYTVSGRIGGSGGTALNYSPTLMISSNLGIEFGISNASNQEFFRVLAVDFPTNTASVGGIPVQVADIGFNILFDQIYLVTATVKRNLDGTVTLNASVHDSQSSAVFNMTEQTFSAADASLLFGTYDVVGFRKRGGQGTGIFNDLSVTFIPEPASFALMGIGGLLMLRRRRA